MAAAKVFAPTTAYLGDLTTRLGSEPSLFSCNFLLTTGDSQNESAAMFRVLHILLLDRNQRPDIVDQICRWLRRHPELRFLGRGRILGTLLRSCLGRRGLTSWSLG